MEKNRVPIHAYNMLRYWVDRGKRAQLQNNSIFLVVSK
jgi:hypothetical protein